MSATQLPRMTYTEALSAAFVEAQAILASDDPEKALADFRAERSTLTLPLQQRQSDGTLSELGMTVVEGLDALVANIGSNKYLYSVFITACVEKLIHPQQDIRRIQSRQMTNGYSNRNTDQTFVTPFLNSHGLTHCAKSGVESGRNVERGIPLDFDHTLQPKGKNNRDIFLGLFHALEMQKVDPLACVTALFVRDMQREQRAVYEYHQPEGRTVQEVVDAVLRHYAKAVGKGKSRLPVLAIHAAYHCLVQEMGRYGGKTLRPVNRHTSNDKQGWVGDVQVDDAAGMPFEAVEVKSGQTISATMVADKKRHHQVKRYYVLSTEAVYIKREQEKDVKAAVADVRAETGCEVIVNGLPRSLWYYLRLLSDPDCFLTQYTKEVQLDQDIQDGHRGLWAEILRDMTGAQTPRASEPT